MEYSPGSTPILARANLPVMTIVIILLIIAVAITLVWIISKNFYDYKKSPEYLEKLKARLSTYKDVKRLATEYNIPEAETALLWSICRHNKVPNIYYYVRDNAQTEKLFHDVYFQLKNANITPEKFNNFFKLQYSIELITAQTKTLISTRQIPVNTVLFYLTNDSEKFPFTLVESTKEAMILEIPEFFYKSPNKPELLERSRYVFKTENGLTYNFISRTMRYEENKDTGKILMLVAHTENLATQMHRHFRREMFDDQCFFSSVKKGTDKKEKYIVSEKKYEGQLSNISGGGCCIKTDLPVKENQLIAMDFPKIQVKEQVIGIIKRTRKLPTGTFALHIQFLDISLESQNMIMAYVYKYEL
mgnify:CR=1 FL=1